MGAFLLIRTIVAPPVVIVGRTTDDLKAFLCKTDWWDHTFTSSTYILCIICVALGGRTGMNKCMNGWWVDEVLS